MHGRQSFSRYARKLIPFALVFVLAGCHEGATTFVVDVVTDAVDANPGDGVCADSIGDCTLRAAIQEANAFPGVEKIVLPEGEIVTLSLVGANEDLGATGDLDVTDQVVLVGDATIDADGIDRALDVHHSSGLVELEGVTITGGAAPDGAAIRVNAAGWTSLFRTTVTGNDASAGAPIAVDGGSLFLWSSTVHDNNGLASGALSVSSGWANLQNATVSGNSGILPAVRAAGPGATITVRHSTVVANSGGALVNVGGAFDVTASIVADQSSGPNCIGSISEGVENLVDDSSCGWASVTTTPIGLGPLADNGGAILTHLPESSSPAVNAGLAAGCTVGNLDARDLVRPAGPACELGAVEVAEAPCPPLPGPGLDLSYCDYSGLDLTDADLSNATLVGTNFTGANLTRATFDGADFTDAEFAGANLWRLKSFTQGGEPASLPAGYSLEGDEFDGRRIWGPGVDLTDLYVGQFSGTTYYANVNLNGADLRGATFQGFLDDSTATGALFDGANLNSLTARDVDFTGASFVNASLLSSESCPDYSGGRFLDSTLVDTDFSGALFCSFTIQGNDLTNANFGTAVFTAQFGPGPNSGNVGVPAGLPEPWFLSSGFLTTPRMLQASGAEIPTSLAIGDTLDDVSLEVPGNWVLPGVGVDWYINNVLFRDNDLDAPYDLSNANPQIVMGSTISGEAGGSGNSFTFATGCYELRADVSTATGLYSVGDYFCVS